MPAHNEQHAKQKVLSEWFWSKGSAAYAGERLAKKHGYSFEIAYKMRADGTHDWRLDVFSES